MNDLSVTIGGVKQCGTRSPSTRMNGMGRTYKFPNGFFENPN